GRWSSPRRTGPGSQEGRASKPPPRSRQAGPGPPGPGPPVTAAREAAPGGQGQKPPSGLHAHLLEVELALQVAQHVVVDGPAVPHRGEHLPLRVDDRAPDLLVLDQLLLGFAALRRAVELVEMLGPVEVRRAQLIEQRPVPRPPPV